ncbi:MAG: ABC transporter permease [Clostridiales bacterium]|nr:ABC transporter permease [Clostridiales bacterium]
MFNGKMEKMYIFSLLSGFLILFFIVFPIVSTFTWTDLGLVFQAMKDPVVLEVILRSVKTATITMAIAFFFSVPFAYYVVRHEFKFKNLLESIIDIPMVMPHTVAGIALLTVLSPKKDIGKFLAGHGVDVLGTESAIVLAMLFVSISLMFNASKEAFKWVPVRMENVSRSLGASHFSTFMRVTFPLAWRDLLSGMIITWARAISEFGAVIILAYHPMIAPTLIYERYTNYGMNYAIPVTVILLTLSLLIFILLRVVSLNNYKRRLQ